MDLMDLKPKSDVVEVLILHPKSGEVLLNDDETEMSITIFAQHAKEYRAAIHEQQDRRLKALQKKSNALYGSAELEKDAIDLLSKITKEWDITYGGEKPKLTLGKAKEIYTEVFWIRSQIEEALNNSLDFTKA